MSKVTEEQLKNDKLTKSFEKFVKNREQIKKYEELFVKKQDLTKMDMIKLTPAELQNFKTVLKELLTSNEWCLHVEISGEAEALQTVTNRLLQAEAEIIQSQKLWNLDFQRN